MGIISCGYILWVGIKNDISTPKIWNNIADILQFCICHLMLFSHKIKCNMEPPLCLLQSSKLILQPLAKKTNLRLDNNRSETKVASPLLLSLADAFRW